MLHKLIRLHKIFFYVKYIINVIKCYTLNSTLQPQNQTLIYSNKIIIKKKIKNICGINIINKDIKYIPKQFLSGLSDQLNSNSILMSTVSKQSEGMWIQICFISKLISINSWCHELVNTGLQFLKMWYK